MSESRVVTNDTGNERQSVFDGTPASNPIQALVAVKGEMDKRKRSGNAPYDNGLRVTGAPIFTRPSGHAEWNLLTT
ncbi:MAG: hypothetical protein JO122_03240 [Acetobacteraceae bacterium]|nr:hypothetical protein [Acetobacteraceae bacterium]